jgi:hypothetical protein
MQLNENQKELSIMEDFQSILCLLENSCKLPKELQHILIKKQQTFKTVKSEGHDLPAKIHVKKILRGFVRFVKMEHEKQRARKQGVDGGGDDDDGGGNDMCEVAKQYKAFARDLCVLFDALLPKFLLYDFERDQYHRIVMGTNRKTQNDGGSEPRNGTSGPSSSSSSSSMSKVYGGEFLLRMIVILPFLFSSIQSQSTTVTGTGTATADHNHHGHAVLSQWKVACDCQIENVAKLLEELVSFLYNFRDEIFQQGHIDSTAES